MKLENVFFEQSEWDRALLLEASRGISEFFIDGFGFVRGVERWPEWIEYSMMKLWSKRNHQPFLPSVTPERVLLGAEGLALIFIGPYFEDQGGSIVVTEPRLIVTERRTSMNGRVFSPFAARVRSDIFDACKQIHEESAVVYKTGLLNPELEESMIFGVMFDKSIYAKNFRLISVPALVREGE